MLGQCDSSHTVARRWLLTVSRTASKRAPPPSFTRSQGGFRPDGNRLPVRAFTPSLMAQNPCRVRNFSPLPAAGCNVSAPAMPSFYSAP